MNWIHSLKLYLWRRVWAWFPNERNVGCFVFAGIIAGILFLIVLLLVIVLFNRIRIAIELIKEASRCADGSIPRNTKTD